MNKELTLQNLRTLGFRPVPTDSDEDLYEFEFEGLDVLMPVNPDDNCVTFLLSRVYDVNDDNRVETMEILLKLISSLKYVQASLFQDTVVLTYTHYLGDSETTPELIEHMLNLLSVAFVRLYSYINGTDDNEC